MRLTDELLPPRRGPAWHVGPYSLMLLMSVALVLAGCNGYGLRYAPESQPHEAQLFADYRAEGNSVAIVVDTDGNKLDDIFITLPDATKVYAEKIVAPSAISSVSIGPPPTVGVAGRPISGTEATGSQAASTRAQGTTTAFFESSKIGPAPWMVTLKVEDVPVTQIKVGGK